MSGAKVEKYRKVVTSTQLKKRQNKRQVSHEVNSPIRSYRT